MSELIPVIGKLECDFCHNIDSLYEYFSGSHHHYCINCVERVSGKKVVAKEVEGRLGVFLTD